MRNKSETILENIKRCKGEKIHGKILEKCEELNDKSAPVNQENYVSFLLEKLPMYCTQEEITQIMQSCGYQCISEGIIVKAKTLYAESTDFSEFLNKLNDQHIGGGNLYIENNKVIGTYNTCYCKFAKNSKTLSPDYCNCSAGWFKKLFSSVLDREIKVSKQRTILDGADKCVFEIFVF